jgi:hypothetical protein
MRSGRARVWSVVSAATIALCLVGGVFAMVADAAVAQRRGRRGFGADFTPWVYDGAFVFCRLAFQESGQGEGGGWSVDYPKADLNFPFRLNELTTAAVSHSAYKEPNHVIVTPTDPNLTMCPFIMATEVGAAYFDEADALALRAYFEKGGFLWADDFWGEYAWSFWENQIRKVLPASEFPLMDLPLTHPIFNQHYIIRYVPQIPSINFWFTTGTTSERFDSTVPHVRAITDTRGRVLVLITHNTDFGDAFEREGEDRRYFDRFAGEGYGFGVNAFLYAMTH